MNNLSEHIWKVEGLKRDLPLGSTLKIHQPPIKNIQKRNISTEHIQIFRCHLLQVIDNTYSIYTVLGTSSTLEMFSNKNEDLCKLYANLYPYTQRTWASVNFGAWGGSWNHSSMVSRGCDLFSEKDREHEIILQSLK